MTLGDPAVRRFILKPVNDMSSKRRIESSRANGRRSKGPVTPEGKERSARNATRHGLLSRILVLESEESSAFEATFQQFLERFGPADEVQVSVIEEMLGALWRQRRCWAIETRMMDNAMADIPDERCNDELDRITFAFTHLANLPQLQLLHRYEARLHRMFQRALQNLLLLRQNTPQSPKPADLPNEPNPISEHSERSFPKPAARSRVSPPPAQVVPPQPAAPGPELPRRPSVPIPRRPVAC